MLTTGCCWYIYIYIYRPNYICMFLKRVVVNCINSPGCRDIDDEYFDKACTYSERYV